MLDIELIPKPRETRIYDRGSSVRRVVTAHVAEDLSDYSSAIEVCLERIVGPEDGREAEVYLRKGDGPPQSYELRVDEGRIDVSASDSAGALYAVRTLWDIWCQTQPYLPSLGIKDFPTYAKRGVFVESNRGSDLMTFQDWCDFIDNLAQLKFNHLAISLYGCWDLRHDGEESEFLYVPLDDFPQLRTTRHMRTWDAERENEISYEYLPRMFEEDFFGEVVRYARHAGMTVIPLFGGPGHNSLLPRLLPELSALDVDGKPTGYGYCVSRPEARQRILEVFSNLVEQHLLPNEIATLGCQGDEFYPILNLDPGNPLEPVSPYCRCDRCREMTPGELLMEYFSLVGNHLSESGIRMFHWQDSLVRENVIEDYAERVSDAGVPSPIVSWWKYNDPIPQLPETPLETWVTPTPGLIGSLFYQDFSLNIEAWLREGKKSGAEGTLAYNMPDPAFHKNYACLADLSWNLEGSGGAAGFKERWARYVAPEAAEQARYAYALGESIVECYPLMTYFLDHLLPYFSTSPKGLTMFPDDLIKPLSVPSPASISILRQTRDTLRESIRTFPETRGIQGWPDVAENWRTELGRIAEHADIFLQFIAAAGRLHHEPLEDVEADIDRLEEQGRELMRRLAYVKVDYQAPAVLREHWYLISALRPALQRMSKDEDLLPDQRGPWHAWLF